jgi:rubrerythrin
MNKEIKEKRVTVHEPDLKAGVSRSQFLKLSGFAVAGSSLFLASCKSSTGPDDDDEIFDLGSGDLAVLNYAYALEQLEADYYTKVVNNFYSGISSEEEQVLTDLYNHEINHRDLFKAAISSVASDEQLLPTLEFDYGDLDFNNRDQVLGTAKVLEDTGVAAYNGAGKLLTNADYLLLAGKIVSVEARHAAAIRSLISPGTASFAGDDIVSTDSGLDAASDPSAILAAVGDTGFIVTPFTANNLP